MTFFRVALLATVLLVFITTVVAQDDDETFVQVSPVEQEPKKEHFCAHDTEAVQRDNRAAHHNVYPQRYAPKAEHMHTLAVGAIRIAISTEDLNDPSKYCETGSGTTPDFKGATVSCTDDDIFNSSRKSILTNNIIPAAIAKLEAALSVDQIAGNLMVASTSVCPHHTIPASHVSTGVSNADFILYVSAGPTTGSTLAWAGYCQLDQNNRPIVGRANWGPKYISWGDIYDQEYNVNTAVHEILHALGFSGTFIQNYFTGGNPLVSSTLRSKSVSLVTSANVITKIRAFTGCSTLTGLEFEDEGGSGTTGSHWDRRNMKEEVMAGIAGGVLTEMTLALMHDSGHYTVDYTKAEAMSWGKDAGCDFINEKCDSTSSLHGTYWCSDTNPSNNYCSHDIKGIGRCGVGTYGSDLPSYAQYFADPKVGGTAQLMDYCPLVSKYSNRYCDSTTYVPTTNDGIFGFTYGTGGRCFVTNTGFIKAASGSGSAGAARCFLARCVLGNYIQFKIGTSDWADCPTNGAAGSISAPTGWTGTIECPTAASFCTSDIYYNPAGTPTPVPPSPVPPTPVPPSPAPATPVPATPVPVTPAPQTPVPPTPMPQTPSPATPSPPTPSPATPAPATPQPPTPNPPTPAPLTPSPQTPMPPTPVPGTPVPGVPPTPVPPTPVPPTPSPATPAPLTPAPVTPVPPTPNPATPNPATPVPPTAVPGVPPTPVPPTPNPPTPAPVTPAPATPMPPTPIPATPVPGVPPTPVPPTPNPATPNPMTPNPATPVPPTAVPPTTATPTTAAPVTPSPPTAVPATPAPPGQTTATPATPAPPTPAPPTPASTTTVTGTPATTAVPLTTSSPSTASTTSVPAPPNTTTLTPATTVAPIQVGNPTTTTAAAATTLQPSTPAPTQVPFTNEPQTPAPPSDATFIAVVVRIPGTRFAEFLSDATKKALLTAAIRADLASILNVDVSRIIIRSLSLGSLVVNFQVERDQSTTAAAVDAKLTAVQNGGSSGSSGSSTLPNTEALYNDGQPAGSQDSLTIGSSSVDNSVESGGDSTCQGTCLLFVGAVIVAVGALILAAVLVVVYFIRKKQQQTAPASAATHSSDEPQKDGNQAPTQLYYNEPYDGHGAQNEA